MLLGGLILLGLMWSVHTGTTNTRVPFFLCYIVITPGMCVLLSEIFNKIPERINSFLKVIGAATFEILLWHVFIMEDILAIVNVESRFQAITVYIFSVAIGVVYKILLDKMMLNRKRL